MSRDAEGTMTHEQWLELAAAYALEALDPADRAAFEGHLGRCAECRLAVQEYREVAGLLVHATEPVTAPHGLQDRVAAMLQASHEGARASEARPGEARASEARASEARASEARASEARASEARPGDAPHAAASGAEGARATPIGAAPTARGRSPQSPPWRSGLLWLAAASLACAAALGALWRRSSEGEQLARREADSLRRAVDDRDSVLASLRGPRVHVVSLTAPDGGPTVARVFWNHEQRRFIVTAFSIPATPRGRTYQLWAIAKGHAPVSMGTFATNTDGVGTVVLPVSADIESLGVIDVCALTEEPDGGSPQPTETPRLVGSWRHTD